MGSVEVIVLEQLGRGRGEHRYKDHCPVGEAADFWNRVFSEAALFCLKYQDFPEHQRDLYLKD